MNVTASSNLPRWFWAIVVAALVWNLLSVAAYPADVTRSDEALAALPEAERALYASVPAWATGAYAVAVFAGVVGSVFLALRNKYAVPLFTLSLAGVAVQMLHAFALTNTIAVLGWSSIIMPAVIIVIAAALFRFSLDARRRGWLT